MPMSFAGDSNDIPQGGAGNDVLDAGTADRLDGGTGNDILIGGAGDDVIEGGTGDSTPPFSLQQFDAGDILLANGATVVDGPDGRDVPTTEQLRFSDREFSTCRCGTG
jgi:Ca2+-binding RTX toxin-like protein